MSEEIMLDERRDYVGCAKRLYWMSEDIMLDVRRDYVG
jgi:hypothetical protein